MYAVVALVAKKVVGVGEIKQEELLIAVKRFSRRKVNETQKFRNEMSIFVRTFSLFYYRHPPTKREPFVAEPNLAKSNNPRVWVDAGKIPFDMDRSHARLFVSFLRHSTRLFIPFRVFVFFSSKFFLSAAHQQPLTIN